MRGYRGLLKELARTRSASSLWLQVRGGLLHLFRAWRGGPRIDGVDQFIRNYGPEGFAIPDGRGRDLALAAQRCLVCGLCSIECARVGGAPPVDPQEAVVALSRLSAEAVRFRVHSASGIEDTRGVPCGSCRACHRVCPVAIPIADIIAELP